MDEKPLHVRVAYALMGPVLLALPEHLIEAWRAEFERNAPAYDTDWSATGPLLEKYGIQLSRAVTASEPPMPGTVWMAVPWDYHASKDKMFRGDTSPLVAVCELIVALAARGKLDG